MKRSVLALTILCLCTLLPFQIAVADDTSMVGQVTVLPGVEVHIPLHTAGIVSGEADARDSEGNTITPSGSSFSLQISESTGIATLPLSLGAGQTLGSFTDPVSGLEITETKFTLSLKDTNGNKAVSISGDIETIESTDGNIEVTAENLVLRSEEFLVDLTSVNEKIGEVTVSFQANLKSLPQDASIKATVSKDPDKEAQAAFQLIFIDEGNKVADIACTLNIEKTSLENSTDLGEATIILKAGRAWAEEYGRENIYIMRYSDEGEAQKLPTTFEGYEGERAVFKAISADGFSVFGLAAITSLHGVSRWTVVLIAIGGSIAVAGLIIYFLIWRNRRREATLKEKWPTGMRQEDWR